MKNHNFSLHLHVTVKCILKVEMCNIFFRNVYMVF